MAGGSHKPIARLRGALLVLMVLVAAALVGLYLFGRAGKPGAPLEDDGGGLATPEGEITLIGEGFEFTHSEGERPVFRVRGDSVRADRRGTVYLDGVGLTLYDESGTGYEVAAERASYNREQRQARLAGEVVLSGPDNTRLATRGLRMVEDGQVLISTGPVRFRWRELTGRAERLRIDRRRDVYTLTGDVRVESLPDAEEEVLLTAQRLFFERGSHQVQAAGDVVVVRDGDRVEAGRINAFMDEDDSQVIFLRARLDVTGDLAMSTATTAGGGEDSDADGAAGTPRRLRFSGRSLSLLRDQQGRLRNAEIEGAPLQPVIAETPSADGAVQRLVAGYLVGEFRNGILTLVRAFNEPRVEELAAAGGEVTRRLDGRRLEARFTADGRMVGLTAEEDVHFRDEQVTAQGDRATFDTLEETGSFFGEPARLESERGELLAPRVDYERDSGVLHARDGVRAVAQEAGAVGLGGTPLGEGEGPVRIESEEAFWRDDPRSALFRGDVRAWRGENLLLADTVRADQSTAKSELIASGDVRTVWLPAPTDGGAAPAAASAPVEVTANTLTYTQPSEVLVYEGQVRAEQGRQVLTCRRLEVELNEAGEAEELTCSGDTRLEDRAGGNSARGERAVYDLTSRKVTMTGEPVTLRKSDGAEVQGGRVVYDLETGTAEVRGGGAGAGPAGPPDPAPEVNSDGDGGGV